MVFSWWRRLVRGELRGSRRKHQERYKRRLWVELLEDRLAPSLNPAQIRHAYGFDQISFRGGTIVGDGTGQTIAIVDAYDNPNFVSSSDPNFNTSDLHLFDAAYGLPDPPVFTKVDQNGGTNYPIPDPGDSTTNPPRSPGAWDGEIALDVEWAHVLAPNANILLVEANDGDTANLLSAVDYARGLKSCAPILSSVSVISMSYSGPEYSNETIDDSHFTTPSGHVGITFVASTGNRGKPGGYPAYSPNVLAVGGTHLSVDSSGNYTSETGWSQGWWSSLWSWWFGPGDSSGGGISTVEPKPSYQNLVATPSTTMRTIPDVAFDADPNTGVEIYDSWNNLNGSPWTPLGGTSFSAPAWASLIAIINQGRVANGLPVMDGANDTLPGLYGLPSSDFHDIASGDNGYSAGPGYDLVTGQGSPKADLIAKALSNDHASSTITVGSSENPALPGDSITVTATVSATAGGGLTPTSSVTFLDNGSSLDTRPINSSGIATFTTSTLGPGTHTMTATYGGDTNFSGGASIPLLQTVSLASAHTLTVTNTSNDSTVVGSLPWAVSQADSDTSGGPLTINFDPIVFATPQTIFPTGALNLNNTTPGESIIIDGPAEGLTIMDSRCQLVNLDSGGEYNRYH